MEKKEFHRHYLPHFQQPGQAYFVTWCLKDAVPSKALLSYKQKLELLKSQIESFSSMRKTDQASPAVSANLLTQTLGSDSLITLNLDSELSLTKNHKSESNNRESEFVGLVFPEIEKLKEEYYSVRRKYLKAYDDLLNAEQNPIVNLSKPENTKALIQTLKFWEGKKLNNFAFTIMSNHIHWVFEVLEKDNGGNPIYLQDLMQSIKRFSANQINKLENRKGSLWQKESFDTTIRNERHLHNAIKYTLNNPIVAGLVSDWKLWPGTFCEPGIGSEIGL